MKSIYINNIGSVDCTEKAIKVTYGDYTMEFTYQSYLGIEYRSWESMIAEEIRADNYDHYEGLVQDKVVYTLAEIYANDKGLHDLIEPTVRQLTLFNTLNVHPPIYSHIPLAVTPEGYKLSKQNKAPAINNLQPQPALFEALNYLGQNPPKDLIHCSVTQIIEWGIKNWSLNKITKKRQIVLN